MGREVSAIVASPLARVWESEALACSKVRVAHRNDFHSFHKSAETPAKTGIKTRSESVHSTNTCPDLFATELELVLHMVFGRFDFASNDLSKVANNSN